MRFECYRAWDQLPSSSEALFAKAESDSAFISREWFESITSYIINDKQELLITCVIADDAIKSEEKILAILPLLTHENKEWSSFCHPYSSLYSILLAETQKSETLECLCQGLKELPFEYLSLSPIAEDDGHLIQLQDAMASAEISCNKNHKTYNWFHRIQFRQDQSFTDYMAERPTKVRNTVERKQRKLMREHGYEIQLYIDNEVQPALADYHDIYKSSWKANEQSEALVVDVVNQFSKRAWPRLAIMTIDEKPIAAQLWFVVEGKASIFRLVYDETWKQYSPGSILMSYLLEYVIDTDKVKEIDFLSGNDAYKRDWMSERRERFTMVFVKKPKEVLKPSENIFSKTLRFITKRIK